MKKAFAFIKNGIFCGHTLFVCGYSYSKLLKKLNFEKSKEWYDALNNEDTKLLLEDCFACCRVEELNGVKYPIVFIRNKFNINNSGNNNDFVVLAHELIHLNQFYLSEFIDRNKEKECEAYFHTYMMNECLNALK